MNTPQAGILQAVPRLARYLAFSLTPGIDPRPALRAWRDSAEAADTVTGIGESLALALDARIDGLHAFPRFAGAGVDVPATPAALWLWLRGADRGELLHRSRRIARTLAPALRLDQTVDAFQYDASRDLTGYEDGTENPQGDAAVAAAIVGEHNRALHGSSFVAVQRWEHELDRFEALPAREQDLTIGRERVSNEEIDDAPASAHVKRTAQESFHPEAFVLRRSMPWAEGMRAGLMFVAFGASLDAFEAQLARMLGRDDGIRDALFGFTRPVSGAYFWCPAVREGRLELSPLGL